MKPYPEYKDSGVLWLGDIPKHWEVKKLKYIAAMKSGDNLTSEKISDAGNFQVYGGNGLRGYYHTFNRDGDFLLIGRQGALCGNIHRIHGKCWATDHAIVTSVHDCISVAWYYYMLILMNLNQYSESAAQPGLSVEKIQNLRTIVPPLMEQQAIAAYLDAIVAQINKFIRNKRRLIALLKEQKQNIINTAVTRGLDPNAKMKSSGVDWLGNIPEHWEVRRLKHVCMNINEMASSKNDTEIYIALENVESWTGCILAHNNEITFDSQVKRYKADDVLFGKLRPYLAKVATPSFCGVCVGEFLVIRSNRNILEPEFLEYKLRSPLTIDTINSSTFGAKMPRAAWNFIGTMGFSYPSRNEQREIVTWIKQATATIDTAISRAEREIDLMREYCDRLIADVVTGQIDVRGMEVPHIIEDEAMSKDIEDDMLEAALEEADEDLSTDE